MAKVAVKAVAAVQEVRQEVQRSNINRKIPVDSAAVIVRSAISTDSPRRQAAINDSTGSRQDTVHHVPVDVSKAKVAPLIFIGQFLVV